MSWPPPQPNWLPPPPQHAMPQQQQQQGGWMYAPQPMAPAYGMMMPNAPFMYQPQQQQAQPQHMYGYMAQHPPQAQVWMPQPQYVTFVHPPPQMPLAGVPFIPTPIVLTGPSSSGNSGHVGHAKKVQQRCEPCDRMFPSMDALRQHALSHVKCDDCTFEGSAPAVQTHRVQAHAAPPKWSYEASEIAAWRAARRRHHPSASQGVPEAEPSTPCESKDGADASKYPPMNPFSLAGVVDYSSSNEDEAEDVDEEAVLAAKVAKKTGDTAAMATQPSDSPANRLAKRRAGASSPPLEVPIGRAPPPSQPPSTDAADADDDTEIDLNAILSKKMKRPKHSLLKSLLAKDIARESDILLQCTHFLVQHGFFLSAPADL